MNNPDDIIRDAILRELYDVHQNAKGMKNIAIGILDLRRLMKTKHGYGQTEVIRNLDYLIDKGWVKKIVEPRTFRTPQGTVNPEPKVTYKISDIGIDRLQTASIYQRKDTASHINITNIHGVTVVGNDNTIVNNQFTDLSRVLTAMKQAVLTAPKLSEESKLEIVSDIDSLQSQIQKPKPNASVIKALWGGIEKSVTAAGFGELVAKGATLLGDLLK